MAWGTETSADLIRILLSLVSQKDSTRFWCQAKKGNKETKNNKHTDEENYCKQKRNNSEVSPGWSKSKFPTFASLASSSQSSL